MFGKYFHSLITHTPILNRIISLRSLNAELQERAFGQANAICKATSNYHPDHIISNIIVRFQVEANKEKHSLLLQQNSTVSNLAKALPAFTNTFLPSALLETNTAEVQAHLERVSDFLLPGQGVWWKKIPSGGIEFLDSSLEATSHPDGPQLHHFRSSNMTEEIEYLKNCWKSCIDREIELPLPTVRRYSDEGELLSLDSFESICIPTANLTPDSSSAHEPMDLQDDHESFEYATDSTGQTDEPNPLSAIPTVNSLPKMETSLAKSLVDIVSNIHLLKRFDNLRKKAKSMKKGVKISHSRQYTSCSQLVKCDVSAAYESAKTQIAEYDKVFYFDHDRLPTLSEYPRDIRSLIHKRNIAQRVLAHEWNTS